ncbi:SDR family NAD(P)-dependent oxidoreductase [Niabella hibiscisoli]|uniref:SDR family NAD(P)-dependent oxidoreductase n=1 Tax=Niabella hibiscisoli TaxID=1825928 RepID=UPI0021D43226|nr:SDR family NAD(P)-dependent oxidoreductase [Niabella hibiscisoli]
MFKLDNKKAIVTGGGSGIGKAVCLVFGKAGAHVFVADLNKEAAATTVQEIEAADGKATPLPLNVASQEEVLTAYTSVGVFDILVNSAVSHILVR